MLEEEDQTVVGFVMLYCCMGSMHRRLHVVEAMHGGRKHGAIVGLAVPVLVFFFLKWALFDDFLIWTIGLELWTIRLWTLNGLGLMMIKMNRNKLRRK